MHGLADDNVVVAHTLRLSSALLAAGRPHSVLPLSGVTHMTPQEVVAENLLLLQVRFLKEALGVGVAQAGIRDVLGRRRTALRRAADPPATRPPRRASATSIDATAAPSGDARGLGKSLPVAASTA